ncbi:hypothetical protein JCM10212_001988 [Sporobolomyces blumeae]
MADPAPAPSGQGTQIHASKVPTIDPFTSPESIVQSLQVQDPQLLVAALVQIDKRAAGLNAKPAPRSSPDLLLDYLKRYPGCDGIFNAWDWANKTNNSPLSTAILSCLTSLIRLLSTDPFTPSPELIKTLLSSKYTPYLERALNPGRNDVTTAALKLANVLVGFAGGRFARKLFGVFGWSPKITTRLFKTRLRTATSSNVLHKPDIRTLLVLLVLSFLSTSDVRLKTQVIETKGLLGGVFKGLNEDPEVVVNLVLQTVFKEVVSERRVGLEARRNVFDEGCINELVKLYDYPLPAITDDAPLPASHPSLSIHRFFYAMTDWLSDQIASSPFGRSSGPQKVLSNLLKSLRVTEDQTHRSLGLYILARSPVLAGAFWSKFPSSLDPRLSSRWISAVTFATQVVALPVSSNLLLPTSSASNKANGPDLATFSPPSVASILDTILPPATVSSLNRAWYTKSLTHANPLVSFLSSIFLLSILQKASKVLEALVAVSVELEEAATGGRWIEAARRVREEIKARLPDAGIVVSLMSRTAAASAAAALPTASRESAAEGRDSKPAGGKDKSDKDKGEESGALLRTNIALRLLYLYHRVSPSLISTLKFDFGKLPQTFAKQGASTARAVSRIGLGDDEGEDEHGESEGEAEKAGQGEEGLKAMTSAYALRLAAVHETGATSFNRPGDHFKSLVPLFALYRVPSLTPSNRSLLLSILKRQLSTPLLFGDSLDEVSIWLEALPVPREASVDSALESTGIDWFEKVVHKTLTQPVKADKGTEGLSEAFSPLMRNALASLAAAATTEPTDESVQAFVRTLFVLFTSCSSRLDLPTKLLESIKEAWKQDKSTKGTVKTLGDVLDVVSGKGKKEKQVDLSHVVEKVQTLAETDSIAELRGYLVSLSPRKENLFAAFGGKAEELKVLLAKAPLPVVALHARAVDVPMLDDALPGHPLTTTAIIATAQIFLHRVIHASTTAEREAFSKALIAISTSATASDKELIKQRFAAKEGLLGFFEEAEESETVSLLSNLVPSLFSPARASDRSLVQPFCAAVLADLRKPSSSTASPRVLGCAALLPFFDAVETLPLADALLARATLAAPALNDDLLAVVLERITSLAGEAEFDAFWARHFSALVTLASTVDAQLARAIDLVLLEGASTLLVVRPAAARSTGSKSPIPYDEWTKSLLSLPGPLSDAQSQVLAALVTNSVDARRAFLAALQKSTSAGLRADMERPLEAALEVASIRAEKVELDDSLAKRIASSILSRDATDEAGARVIELLRVVSAAARSATNEHLESSLASTDRDGFKASVLTLVGRLAKGDPELSPILEGFVNGSFEGLTRKFVDASEGEEVEVDLCIALRRVLDAHKIALKGHLVEPLVTSIATNRLNHPEAAELGIAVARHHQFKDNEVTRHLNEIFASAPFQTFLSSSTDLSVAATSTIKLALALAAQSSSATLSARAVDRLLPFYRGTLSALDRALLDTFSRAEASGSTSISSVFKAWNPSTDSSTLLDGTRIGALGVTQRPFVRRSLARAFASSRTAFSLEEDAKTYDPRFLVAYVLALVEEDDLKPQEWTTFLESGTLGTVVSALAASDNGLRSMARATLAGMAKKIAPLTFREKDEVALLLAHCRNAIFSPAGEPVPSSIALFLAHCSSQIGTPASPLYPAFMRFLLQRPSVDMRDVPMFYTMMYSSNSDEWAAAPREERGWMIRYLTEGLVRTQDWKIYRRRQVFELVASLFQSSRHDAPLRKLILQFIVRATSIPTAARELLSRNGLVGWVAGQAPLDAAERRLFVEILVNVSHVMTFEKLTGVADLLDALTAVVASDVASLDLKVLLTLLLDLVNRLPIDATDSSSSPSPMVVLVLARLSSLLSTLVPTLASPLPVDVARLVYSTTMALAFTKFEVGVKEDATSRRSFDTAIEVGLAAGIDELRRELIKTQ